MAEFNLGVLSYADTQIFNDSVGGTDLGDLYAFSLDASNAFNLSLTGLSSDINVELYLDSNPTNWRLM